LPTLTSAGGGVGEDHEQGLVAQADDVGRVDGSEEVLDLLLGEGGALALMGDVLGASNGGGGVETDTGIELLVGEKMPQGRQVLLLAGCGQRVAVLVEQMMLDISRCKMAMPEFWHCWLFQRNGPCTAGLRMRTRIVHGQPFGQGGVIEGLVSRHQGDGAGASCLMEAVDFQSHGELYGIVGA